MNKVEHLKPMGGGGQQQCHVITVDIATCQY